MEQIERLTAEVASLRVEASAVHDALADHNKAFSAQTRTIRRRSWVVAALLAVLTVALIVAVVELRAQVDATRRSSADQRRLCPLVQLLIPQPGDAPPTTRRGIQMTDAAREYATAIHCTSS